EDGVNRHHIFRNGAGQEVDGVLDRLHGVVHLMGDGGSQAAGGGELLNLQHAPLHLELLHLAYRGQIAQDGHGKGDLSAFIKDLAGAGVILDFLLQRRVVQAQWRSFTLGEGVRESVNVSTELDLIAVLNGIAGDIERGAKKFLGERVNQYDLGLAIANNNGIADVFNNQVEAVAVLANNLFGI